MRPALQRRMHGADTAGAGHIQYNLLAIVDDPYLRASDGLEMLKRERAALERRLAEVHPEGWEDKVRASLVSGVWFPGARASADLHSYTHTHPSYCLWGCAGRRRAPRTRGPRVRHAAPAFSSSHSNSSNSSNRAGAGLRRGLRRAEDGAGARDSGHARARARAGLGAVCAGRARREGRRRGGGREGGERSGTSLLGFG